MNTTCSIVRFAMLILSGPIEKTSLVFIAMFNQQKPQRPSHRAWFTIPINRAAKHLPKMV
jgi:hypothetical protein